MPSSQQFLVRVIHYDDKGRPGTCEIVYPDQEVDISQGAHFLSIRPGRPELWRPEPSRAVPTAG